MADVGRSRAPSAASAETLQKTASLSSSQGAPRRDSRDALPYASYTSSAGVQRMMHMPQAPGSFQRVPAAGMPAYSSLASSVISPAPSVRSAASNFTYGMQVQNTGVPYAGSVMSSRGFAEIPTATSDNNYLGFCKGAWKVQNGDRKGAMERCKEAQSWSRNAGKTTTLPAHLKCQQQKCSFRSNYISPDASLIWDKVTTYSDKGVKIRWRFLAKSHVPQRVAIKNQYAFKCLICVYTGKAASAGVYVGTDMYLEHINSEHRGQHFHDVILYKIGCINDRVAEDDEDFDINIWPLSVHHEPPPAPQYLSDALLGDPNLRPSQASSVSGMNCNQPWIMDSSEYEGFHAGHQPEHSSQEPYANIVMPASPPMSDHSNPRVPPGSEIPFHDLSTARHWPQQNGVVSLQDQSERRLSEITDDSQASALTTGLTNVLQVFGDGYIVIDQIKSNHALTHLPFLDLLEQALQDSPEEIKKEWQRGVHWFGSVYEAGDYVAIIALSQMTIQLHNKVVDKLRRAVYGGESVDLRLLADTTDLCRQQTIAILHEFRRRLMHPSPNHLAHPSVPPTAAAAMQQAQQAQREATTPRQHISHMRPDLWKDPYMPNAASRNASNASSSSNKSLQRSQNSDAGSGRRRSSVLGTIKEKAGRKVSFSKDTQQQRSVQTQQASTEVNVDELSRATQNQLSIHPALRNNDYGLKQTPLADVAELDAPINREAST